MKHFLLLAAFYFAAMTDTAMAHTWRVNNDPAAGADFVNVNAAIAAAATGDTLQIEPSATIYEAFVLNKRLVLLGNGYFLGGATRGNINFVANQDSSLVRSMTIDSNSVTGNASGSYIAGLSFSTTVNLIHNVRNITLARCRFLGPLTFAGFNRGSDSLNIVQCFLESDVNSSTITAPVNVNFQFNIFSAATGMGTGTVNLDSHFHGLFRNNTFNNATTGFTLNNYYMTNNVFTSPGMTVLNGGNNILLSNLFAAAVPGIGDIKNTGNGVFDLTGQFTGSLTAGYGDQRFQSKLPVNLSLIREFGEMIDGVQPDVGAYNLVPHVDSYRASGLLPVPVITQFFIKDKVTVGTQQLLRVILSLHTNN